MKLRYTVRDSVGLLVGKLAFAEDAAALVSAMGEGAEVKVGRTIVWVESANEKAGESYDAAAAAMHKREDQ